MGNQIEKETSITIIDQKDKVLVLGKSGSFVNLDKTKKKYEEKPRVQVVQVH